VHRWLSPLRLALILTAFDGAWAVQALSVIRVQAVSNVELISAIVWCYFHLPAALIASVLLQPLGSLPEDPAQMPLSALGLLVALGLLQTFGLVYGAWRWTLGRRKALR
jgi:hypothetical protein